MSYIWSINIGRANKIELILKVWLTPNYWCLERYRMAKQPFPQLLNNPVSTSFNSVHYGIFLEVGFLPNRGLCLGNIK